MKQAEINAAGSSRIASSLTSGTVLTKPACALNWWQFPKCPFHACQANAEPPFLGRHRIQIQYWGGAIAALETLILRVGSLEAVLTSPEPLLNELRLQELLGEPNPHTL